MRKSVALLGVGGIVVAAVAVVLGLWLPASHRRADAAWTRAGERALGRVALPPPYSTDGYDARNRVCSNGPDERCFLGPGDPTAQVATVRVALADITTGPVRASCFPVPLPGSPPSCHLVVPVADSRLAVDLFARPRDPSKPLAQRTYAGAYVVIHLDQR
jgi:hypothetical protein